MLIWRKYFLKNKTLVYFYMLLVRASSFLAIKEMLFFLIKIA